MTPEELVDQVLLLGFDGTDGGRVVERAARAPARRRAGRRAATGPTRRPATALVGALARGRRGEGGSRRCSSPRRRAARTARFADLPPEQTELEIGDGGRSRAAEESAREAATALRERRLRPQPVPGRRRRDARQPDRRPRLLRRPVDRRRDDRRRGPRLQRGRDRLRRAPLPGPRRRLARTPTTARRRSASTRRRSRPATSRPFEAAFAEGAPAVVLSHAFYTAYDPVTPASLVRARRDRPAARAARLRRRRDHRRPRRGRSVRAPRASRARNGPRRLGHGGAIARCRPAPTCCDRLARRPAGVADALIESGRASLRGRLTRRSAARSAPADRQPARVVELERIRGARSPCDATPHSRNVSRAIYLPIHGAEQHRVRDPRDASAYGERSGYEIKQAVDHSTRFFWAASYGQIYPELKQLAEAGLIEGDRRAAGRAQADRVPADPAGRRSCAAGSPSPPDVRAARRGAAQALLLGRGDARDAGASVAAKRRPPRRACASALREIEPSVKAPDDPYPHMVLRRDRVQRVDDRLVRARRARARRRRAQQAQGGLMFDRLASLAQRRARWIGRRGRRLLPRRRARRRRRRPPRSPTTPPTPRPRARGRGALEDAGLSRRPT